jgi:hypothetical protein
MNTDDLLKQQRTALEQGDIAEALTLLEALERSRRKSRLWEELKQNEPESYEELTGKLREAAYGGNKSERTVLQQLARVFGRCNELGIELSTLEVSKHLHKYREAAANLNDIVDESGEGEGKALQDGIQCIKSDANRAQTRAWARKSRKSKSEQLAASRCSETL